MEHNRNYRLGFYRDFIITILILSGMGLITFLILEQYRDTSYLIFIYILAVILISKRTCGYFLGVMSAVISSISLFLVYHSASVSIIETKLDLFIILICFIVISGIISRQSALLKKHKNIALMQEKRTEDLYDISKKLHASASLQAINELILNYTAEFTGRTVILYNQDPQLGHPEIVYSKKPEHLKILESRHEQFVVHKVYEEMEIAGVGTPDYNIGSAVYFPIKAHQKVLCVVGVFCENQKGLDQDQITYIQLMAAQAAMALERQQLSDAQRQLEVESEKEKMRNNLLRAVSHDLRTPLTSMIGTSAALLENMEYFKEEQKLDLIKDIHDDSTWLLHMVENLLSVTRIKDGSSSVSKTPEPLDEVVAEAVARFRKRYPKEQINVSVPGEFILVPMDAILIEQVLLNLLENAVKYSESIKPVELTVLIQEPVIQFQVRDYGIGIRGQDPDSIFDGNSVRKNRSSDTTKGAGIGLSICKTIIHAHNGSLIAINCEDGGALFQFTLPFKGEYCNE